MYLDRWPPREDIEQNINKHNKEVNNANYMHWQK